MCPARAYERASTRGVQFAAHRRDPARTRGLSVRCDDTEPCVLLAFQFDIAIDTNGKALSREKIFVLREQQPRRTWQHFLQSLSLIHI